MFTGIIEGLGVITAYRPSGEGRRITVTADFDLAGTRIGDSIAVNGACLTAVTLEGRRFTADISPETVSRSTFGAAKVGDRVNLERALTLSSRLDGHMVSGHLDGTGRLTARREFANAIILTFSVPKYLTRYMIEKGSVAVDGVSLTINRVDDVSFDVSLIPHTAALTTVGHRKVWDDVNIETDLIGKYVERLLSRPASTGGDIRSGSVDMALLARTGFLH